MTTSSGRENARWTASLVCLALAALAGCSESLETEYGRRGGAAASSVNGTAVLARMFADRGHQVASWRYLSPKLDSAQTIVWFPDDLQPPSDEVREWLEVWLSNSPGRTLVYVGRDFDAAPGYWQWMKSHTTSDSEAEVRRQELEARLAWQARHSQLSVMLDCPWFSVEPLPGARQGKNFSGIPTFTAGVHFPATQIILHSRMEPSQWAEPWLLAGDDVLISQEPFELSQLILVANGSFLLNLPLVNAEHRKLASRLVDRCGAPGKVFFLESGNGGPQIVDRDPTAEGGGLNLLGVWPLSGVLVHLAAAGLVLLAWRLPIFGTPREEPRAPSTDFGQHIRALGALLERTHDAQYARNRCEQYAELARGDSRRAAGQALGSADQAVDRTSLPSAERGADASPPAEPPGA